MEAFPKPRSLVATGLSNQTSSVIMKQLESEGLLIKGTPIRGKVGQPSVPMSLNPEGAFSIGFKFGRRSADLVLMDFVGRVRQVLRENYAYPTPNELERFVRSGVVELTQGLDEQQTKRICGFGIAAPFRDVGMGGRGRRAPRGAGGLAHLRN